MAGIFFLFFIAQALLFFGKRRPAFILCILNLVWILALLFYHATTTLQIRL